MIDDARRSVLRWEIIARVRELVTKALDEGFGDRPADSFVLRNGKFGLEGYFRNDCETVFRIALEPDVSIFNPPCPFLKSMRAAAPKTGISTGSYSS